MLKILIAEDDAMLAATLKELVEENPRYRVVEVTDNAERAITAAGAHDPDLVLLDLHLAQDSTGFPVAVNLADRGVATLFVSGKAPDFPMPDLALGCLMKPFTADELHRALAIAEDLLRERETLRKKLPENLMLYHESDERPVEQAGYIPSRRSLKTYIIHWISRRLG